LSIIVDAKDIGQGEVVIVAADLSHFGTQPVYAPAPCSTFRHLEDLVHSYDGFKDVPDNLFFGQVSHVREVVKGF
jgi:hypothetical protein